MKTKLKLIKIIALFFLLSPTICLAKTIEIDNVSYDVSSILETDTYTYNAKTDTLTLNNANLKTIKSNNNLKIVLIGDNYLINDNVYLNCIVAKEIEITGDGSLTIDTNNAGVMGSKILINRTNLNIKALDTAFSSINTDMIINNSKLKLETEYDVFNVGSGDLYLNNSNIVVNKARNLIGGFGEYIYVNNTNLKLLEVEGIRVNQLYVYVNGISNVFINATRNFFPSTNYIVSNDLIITGSEDNINYYEITNDSIDKYIKIESTLDLDLLKEKLEEIKKSENELVLKKEELINEENKVNLEKEKITLKEEELILKEEELNKLQINLYEKKLILDDEKMFFNKKEEELKIWKQNLEDLKNELINRSLSLDKKEEELNFRNEALNKLELSLKKECQVTTKEENINDDVKNVDKNNREVNDYIDNPKTFDSFKRNLIMLIISFLGILCTIIIKRKGSFDG